MPERVEVNFIRNEHVDVLVEAKAGQPGGKVGHDGYLAMGILIMPGPGRTASPSIRAAIKYLWYIVIGLRVVCRTNPGWEHADGRQGARLDSKAEASAGGPEDRPPRVR